MKKNVLKIGAILGLSLIAFAGISQANTSNTSDDDKKKKKRIEKRIEVEEKNGETNVTITTIKNGKKKVEKLSGAEAKEYLEQHGTLEHGEKDIEIKIDLSSGCTSSFPDTDGKNIKKKVEVKEENGEKVVTVVTVEDGKEKVEEYKGEAAEKYLSEQSAHVSVHSFPGNHFKFDMKELGDLEGLAEEEIHEKLKEMLKGMEGQGFSYNFDSDEDGEHSQMDIQVFMDGELPEDVQEMLEGLNIDIDQLMEEAEEGSKRRIMVTTMVMVEDMENEEGQETLDLEVFELFPNPNDGQLRVKFVTENDREAIVTVKDLNGKEVYKNKVEGSTSYELNVDLGGEASGTYIVTVDQGQKRKSKKLILK